MTPNSNGSEDQSNGRQRPTILVVDDEPEAADNYAEVLSMDFNVKVAYGGRAALDKVDSTVDIIFLDRDMPDMTGDEALRKLREEEGFDGPVAMVTGIDADVGDIDLPFDDYLTKPVTSDQLTGKAEELIRRTEWGDEYRELFAASAKESAIEDDPETKQRPIGDSSPISMPQFESIKRMCGVVWGRKMVQLPTELGPNERYASRIVAAMCLATAGQSQHDALTDAIEAVL